MKRWWFYGVIILFVMVSVRRVRAEEVSIYDVTRQAGYEVVPEDSPKATLVADAVNGQILWQDQIDVVRDPASITKVMTVYLVMEAIERGDLSFESTIQASESDMAIARIYALSNNQIVAGVEYPVRELLKMALVPSSNVATVMLSRAIATSDGEFIRMMNDKAETLGMTRTRYYNATGATTDLFEGHYYPEGIDPHQTNETTARDIAVLAVDLWRRFPNVIELTSEAVVIAMEDSPYEERFETYNYSLPGAKYGMEGIVGLKTGSSSEGAFNYVALYEKDGMRLVEVVLGVGNWTNQSGEEIRHLFGNALLEKITRDFSNQTLLEEGEQEINGQQVIVTQPLSAVVKNDAQPTFALEKDYVIYQSPYEVLNGKQLLPVATLNASHRVAVHEEPKVEEFPQHANISRTYSSFSKWMKPILVMITLLLVGGYYLIHRVQQRKRRRDRRRRR